MLYLLLLSFLLNLPCISLYSAKKNQQTAVLKPYKYELAITAIFQNEEAYLKEWIEFHLLVGVQHFYLYNNLSSDNYLDILQPYIDQDIVELIQWPYKADFHSDNWVSVQSRGAFMDCVKRSKGKVKWVAFLDTDEFLFPVKETNLVNFLKNYEEFGGVTANWVYFGTSNVEKIAPNELMIEKLYLTMDTQGNQHIKTIARPECVLIFNNPHFCEYQPGFFQVNSNRIAFTGPFSLPVVDQIRINHYWARDNHFYKNVKLKRQQIAKVDITDPEGHMSLFNKEPDYVISKFIPALKEKMGLVEEDGS